MAYQAIYRKWRPAVFEDIIGQSHITNTLKNQIKNDKISHAYLFCGTRGTGKTTAAKVFSRAVNCLNPKDGSPCNECEICKGILDGSILDVVEIDAASNNGVDNIRELREDTNFVATRTKYTVYIIDEVHMLSDGAFNALLKTLEEPPGHVIFILATTEVHKIPETILSRCQRFDFKRISQSDIIVRMKEIAVNEGIDITDDAYALLAQLAEGSMRDGLSILERCISSCGNKITKDDIIDILGMTGTQAVSKVAEAVISGNTPDCLEMLDRLSKEGKNLNVFCDSLISYFRDLLICKVSENCKDLLNRSDEELVKIKALSDKATFEKLSNVTGLLTKTKNDAKWIKNPRTIYELALIKLTRPELDNSNEALLDRLAKMEEITKNPIIVEKTVEEPQEKVEEKSEKKTEISAKLFVPIDKSTLTKDSPIVKIARNWDKQAGLMVKKYNYLFGMVSNRKITIDGEGILLLFNDDEAATKNLAVKYIDKLQEAFASVSGSNFLIKPVFYNDVKDVMIDFWNLPDGQTEAPKKDTETSSKQDPLDDIIDNYPEIVELDTNKKEMKIDENSQCDIFEQNEEEDEREEFPEDNELSDDE